MDGEGNHLIPQQRVSECTDERKEAKHLVSAEPTFPEDPREPGGAFLLFKGKGGHIYHMIPIY